GRQVARETMAETSDPGSRVRMTFDWPAETVEEFNRYFGRFLVPAGVTFKINGREVEPRPPRFGVEAQLTTEVYNPDAHSWQKPRRKTTIELVAIREGEEPFIYEMGIPVAPAEWSVPFHANVLQRVPMNPNRDALAAGYAKRIHANSLPVLLPVLEREQ